MKILENDFPLFPLNTVLFPQARLPLYIFEPRYQEMINRCLDEDLAFGVLLIKEGSEVGAPAVSHQIGTAARIVDVARAEDGRMNIIVMGVTRFKLLEPFTQRSYTTGRIQIIPDENVDLSKVEFTARRTTQLFKGYVKKIQAISETETESESEGGAFQLPKDPTHLSYLIASNLPISNPDRQSLLEAKTVKDRLQREILFLERELNLLRLVTESSDRVRDQGSFSLN
jgi:Lon protease-like protein